MKIAIPVEGENLQIVKRTGQAPYYALFNDSAFERIVEAPKSGHAHHHHEDDEAHVQGHGKSLENLVGIEIMLVRMIGEHMREAVDRAGIKVKKIREKHGERADEAVRNYLGGSAS